MSLRERDPVVFFHRHASARRWIRVSQFRRAAHIGRLVMRPASTTAPPPATEGWTPGWRYPCNITLKQYCKVVVLLLLLGNTSVSIAQGDRSTNQLTTLQVYRPLSYAVEGYAAGTTIADLDSLQVIAKGPFGISYTLKYTTPGKNNHRLTTYGGLPFQVTLPDSTRFILNRCSSMKYCPYFAKGYRGLSLSGETYRIHTLVHLRVSRKKASEVLDVCNQLANGKGFAQVEGGTLVLYPHPPKTHLKWKKPMRLQ